MAPHAPLVLPGHINPLLGQKSVSIAQPAPIHRPRRPLRAWLAQPTHNLLPAKPLAFATQASPETAHIVLCVPQASIKWMLEMPHAAPARLENTQHRRRPWAVKIALPSRTPQQVAQSAAATPGSRG